MVPEQQHGVQCSVLGLHASIFTVQRSSIVGARNDVCFLYLVNAEKCDGKFVAGKVEVVIFVEKKMKILRYFDKL